MLCIARRNQIAAPEPVKDPMSTTRLLDRANKYLARRTY